MDIEIPKRQGPTISKVQKGPEKKRNMIFLDLEFNKGAYAFDPDV